MSDNDTSPRSAPKGTREKILESAMNIIVEQGVGGLRIRELARAVGIREGSIYNHFEGREAIVRELFQGLDARLSPLGAVLDLEKASGETLASITTELQTRGFTGFLIEAKNYFIDGLSRDPAALQLIRAVLSARFHDEAARRAYEEVFSKDVSRVFGSICLLAAELGMLKPRIRSDAVAGLIAAAFEQSFMRCYDDENLERFDSILSGMLEVIGAIAI
jgi:AcrR family transcriptional regulator